MNCISPWSLKTGGSGRTWPVVDESKSERLLHEDFKEDSW